MHGKTAGSLRAGRPTHRCSALRSDTCIFVTAEFHRSFLGRSGRIKIHEKKLEPTIRRGELTAASRVSNKIGSPCTTFCGIQTETGAHGSRRISDVYAFRENGW